MAAFPGFAQLGKAGAGLPQAGRLPQAPKPPKPPGVGRAGGGLLGLAGKLTQPNLGGALNRAAGAGVKNNDPGFGRTLTPGGPIQPQPAGGADSNLDSTFYQNVAANQFKVNNAINADQAKIGNDRVGLQAALGQLAYQEPRSDLALEQNANNRGALFSSVYGQQLADLGQKFLTQRNAAESRYGGDIQGLTAAIAALQGGLPLYEAGQAEASAQRAAAAAEKNPSLGANPPSPTAAPSPAPVASAGRTQAHRGGQATGPGSSLLNLARNLSRGRRR